MSDSTANAREPSMEDILASIRRIIDEEDTRDARPASDMAVEGDEGGDGAEIGAPPVMAAAPVGRDDAVVADGGEARSGAADGEQGDAIFPERESLFWSRATGRGDAATDRGDAGTKAESDAQDSPRTDIFRRAQSKLGAIPRPGARERIQSLANRAEERAESVAEERGMPVDLQGLSELSDPNHAEADRREDDGMDDAPDEAASTVAAFADAHFPEDDLDAGQDSGRDDAATRDDMRDGREEAPYPDIDASDVLDLTEPLDRDGPSDDDTASRFDGLSDDEDRMDIARDDMREDETGGNETGEGAVEPDPESLHAMFAPRGSDGGHDEDDVLELTTPLVDEPVAVDAGSVENGDDFHVSDVVATEDGETGHGIEEAISRNLESRDDDDEHARDAGAPDTASRDDAPEEGGYSETPSNTYSRFDSDSDSDREAPADEPDETASEERDADDPSGHADTPVEDDRADDAMADRDASSRFRTEYAALHPAASDETRTDDAVADEAVADEVEEDDIRRAEGRAGDDEAAPAETTSASGTADPYAAAFMMLDDEPSADDPETGRTALAGDLDRLDDLDMGDELGFSDTFSASDVYHDDPPSLDEDYSRSLEVEDEPVSADRNDASRDDDPRDDGMEKVGGLVRDAMERDPVDYADPSALVSMTSEEISARALASLADVEGEASRRMFGSLRISDEDGSESLEGMVRGMLRPLLREWLDDNLPTMVESAVRGEVERISAKSRKYSRASEKD